MAEMEMVENPRNAGRRPEVQVSIMEQPLSVRLNPRHPDGLHARLITELGQKVRAAREHIEQRYEDWDKVDENMRLYVDLRRQARLGDKTYDPTKKEMPFKRAICIPLTYSTVMTRAAHIYSLLTQRDPFLHFQPRESSDFHGARLHEVLGMYDMEQSNIDLQVWQLIMGEEKYGMGIWYDTWEQEYGEKKSQADKLGIDPDLARALGLSVSDSYSLLKEWNNVRCIDPRYFLPDPQFPVADVQKMGYVGHTDFVTWLYLQERRLDMDQGPYFNVDEARRLKLGTYEQRDLDSRNVDGAYSSDLGQRRYPIMPLHRVQWKLIPSEWGLSDDDYPQIWWFDCVGQSRGVSCELIVRAHKSVYSHNEYTYSLGQGDMDQHAPFVPGIAQQIIGMQDASDWFTNSHITNTRKMVNDQVIYNDDLMSRVDMNSPGPARHIRLTKKGKALHERGILPIQSMYGQFNITDVTGGHLRLTEAFLTMTQRMGATPDTMQGMPLSEQRTLGEVETVNQSATMRLGTIARMLDRQVIKTVAERLVSNRQEFTTLEQAYRVGGALAETMGVQSIVVSPEDLAGNYDYVPRTPTMAEDPARQAALWGSIMQILAQAPQLMQPGIDGRVIDVQKIFNEFLKANGINFFDNFYVQSQPNPMGTLPGQTPEMTQAPQGGGAPAGVVDDQEIARQVEMGNMVPMNIMGGV